MTTEITPEDCDNARKLNNGKLYLGKGDYSINPKCNIRDIHFIGYRDFNGEFLTTVMTTEKTRGLRDRHIRCTRRRDDRA